MKLKSYVLGKWVEGAAQGTEVSNAVTGKSICWVNSEGIDFADVLTYARRQGGKALRQMTIHDRANALKELGLLLLEKKEHLYEVSSWTGATKADS